MPDVLCAASLPGSFLTYRGSSTRAGNRILIVLVLVTIVVVAIWAMNGGLDDISARQTDTVTVSG